MPVINGKSFLFEGKEQNGVSEMVLPPHRIPNHEIDSKACALVPFSFSKDWELRDLTGRDFGVDKIAEHFRDGYATSELLMLQIKGTKDNIDRDNPRFPLKTRTLLYAEMFSVPFLLVYCSINEPNRCYYLWLQEYIRVRLNYETPNWRYQESNTVYFPKDNVLGTKKAEEHLTYIAQFPKFQLSWVDYYSCLNDLCDDIPSELEYDLLSNVDINTILGTVLQKLIDATKRISYIPQRFIPDCFEQTIKLGKEMLDSKFLTNNDNLFIFLTNCRRIQLSVKNIAMRFNVSYLRTLYEIDGTADF